MSVQPLQLVYALGQIAFDFATEARRDSITQHMDGSNPHDPTQLLSYLEANHWDASSILWTLNLESTPIYGIHPHGAFAEATYNRLRQFLREQVTEGVERVSLAGVITGQVRLMSGQVVPTIQPSLRCMYSWTTGALVEALSGKAPAKSTKGGEQEAYTQTSEATRNFLERVYHDLRNLGMTPQERAINYAATNALNAERIFEATLREEMQLDTIEVERSPIWRPESECWEVKLTFFNPRRQLEQARRVYRFTVDVSDVCPVMVGKMRSWYVR
jgi:cyanobactin maturation PatA/PatG family protease